MKKFNKVMIFALLAAMCVMIAGCGKKEAEEVTPTESTITSALELMTTVWESYAEEDRFSAAGGDLSEENMTMDGPGKYSIEDATSVDTMLGFPQGEISKIDDASSLMHMMNQNTFTGAAYHVTDESEIQSLAEALRDHIKSRQWMCGFPDKLVIIQTEEYLVSCFGELTTVDTFVGKVCEVYPQSKVLFEEGIQ